MTRNNNFSKKPWIPEFFPRGTIVEFDTSISDTSVFGNAGVGTVDTLSQTSFENTVLMLKDVTLTKGEFNSLNEPGTYTLSSSYVTRILKRGPGSYVEQSSHDEYPTPLFGFGTRLYQYEVGSYIRHLLSQLLRSKLLPSTVGSAELVKAFLATHHSSDQYYVTKRVKKWFLKNYNRFLLSSKDLAIWNYYDECENSIMMEDALDLLDSHRSRSDFSSHRESKDRILRNFQESLNQKIRDRKWGVLTKQLTQKYLKVGKEIYRVTVEITNRPTTYFFTDISDFNQKIDPLLNLHCFEHDGNITYSCQVATQEDLAMFEPSEEHGVQALSGLYGFIDFVHYLVNDYDPNAGQKQIDSSDMDGSYYSLSDFDFT